MRLPLILIVCLVAVACACVACGRGRPDGGAGRDRADVVTTFYPTRYFAERIARGQVRVECPTPQGADPIFWQPDREAIARFQGARLVVLNGAEYERWAATASLPLSRVCDSAHVFEAEFVKYQATTHSHGRSGAHSHEGTDGHTWMDPNNASRQAEQVLLAMAREWPEHDKAFRDGYVALAADLALLDKRLAELGPRLERTGLVASHPAYGYLAKRYGWRLVNVDLPPDEEPEAGHVEKVRSAIEGFAPDRVLVLFESEPNEAVARAARGAGAAGIVVYQPVEMLGAEDAGLDYLGVMNRNIDRLAAALDAVGAWGAPPK